MSRQPCLVVFLKAPRLGAVKTRLARDVGTMAAWRFYRETSVAVLRDVAAGTGWRTVLAVTPDAFVQAGRFWPSDLPRIAQGRGNLGARMASAMTRASKGPVVLIGGDIPAIRRRHIAAAMQALRTHDMVFGPAEDGGYWLVGLRRAGEARRLFRHVRWSSPHALGDSLANLPAHRRVKLVDRLSDVDTGVDYRRHLDSLDR